MSVVTKRAKASATVQEPGARDGQGKPTYGTASTILARIVREDAVARMADGSEVKTSLTMWVPASQTLPDSDWLVTYSDTNYTVVERKEGRKLDGTLDHVRYRCREE